MTKIQSQSIDLTQALERLKEAVALPQTAITMDATIQRFEFCFELSWKLMQAILNDNGIATYGVRNVIREAVKLGLISSPDDWFGFLEQRNLSVHTYNEEIAQKVYNAAKEFVPSVTLLLDSGKRFLE